MSTPAGTGRHLTSPAGAGVQAGGAGRWWAWARPWRATILLVLLLTLARLVYISWLCPYTLVEDEAHYWEWSRRLDWSYYTKGPGIAWVIASSRGVLEATGLATLVAPEAVVRMPAALWAGVLMLAAAWLGRRVSGDGRVGFVSAGLAALAPMLAAGGVLLTIDMPYMALWLVAACGGWAALRAGGRCAWLLAGAGVGGAFLFKYTILLLLPGLLIFAIVHRRSLRLTPRWPRWAAGGAALMLLGLAPVILWNAGQDWPTVRHLLGHLGLAGGDMPVKAADDPGRAGWSPRWTLEFIGAQFGLIGAPLVLMGWAVVRSFRGGDAGKRDSRQIGGEDWLWAADGRFLICCAAPVIVFYLGVTLIAEAEGNWALAGYTTLLPLAAGLVVARVGPRREAIVAWRVRRRTGRGVPAGTASGPNDDPASTRSADAPGAKPPATIVGILWGVSLWGGLAAGIGMLRLDLAVHSAAGRLGQRTLVAAGLLPPGRTLIPIARLTGQRAIAADVSRLSEELSSRVGRPAFVIAEHYGRASQLAFYMPGQPSIYCSSSRAGGRRTTYDFWQDTDLDDPALLGRPAVLLGGSVKRWSAAFAAVEDLGVRPDETKRGRLTLLGLDYRGFPSQAGAALPAGGR